MKPLYRGIAVGLLQCLLMLGMAGKYAWDREHLPRAWARAVPYDPNLPIRGRYVSLTLEVDDVPQTGGSSTWATISARNGELHAEPAPIETGVNLVQLSGSRWRLADPVDFFISEHIPDPSRRSPGEELWVEVSLPTQGPPRPIRLAVKKDGVLKPLELQ